MALVVLLLACGNDADSGLDVPGACTPADMAVSQLQDHGGGVSRVPDYVSCGDFTGQMMRADTTGDGVPELVHWAPCEAPDVLRIWTDGWTTPVELPLPGPADCVDGWAVVPADGDCYPDLVVACDREAPVVFRGPDFQESMAWPAPAPGLVEVVQCSSGKSNRHSTAVWADLDGDFVQDRVVVQDECAEFDGRHYSLGRGDGSLGPAVKLPETCWIWTGADAIPDSRGTELVGTACDSGGIELFTVDADGVKPAQSWALEGDYAMSWNPSILHHTTCPDGPGSGFQHIADLDGDGWADLWMRGSECHSWRRGGPDGLSSTVEELPYGMTGLEVDLGTRFGVLTTTDPIHVRWPVP